MASMCLPPSSYVEVLLSDVLVLKGGASERCLGHNGRTLMNGMGAFRKEIPQNSLVTSACEDTKQILQPENLTMLAP